MCCSVLHCVAVCCSVLQCVALTLYTYMTWEVEQQTDNSEILRFCEKFVTSQVVVIFRGKLSSN